MSVTSVLQTGHVMLAPIFLVDGREEVTVFKQTMQRQCPHGTIAVSHWGRYESTMQTIRLCAVISFYCRLSRSTGIQVFNEKAQYKYKVMLSVYATHGSLDCYAH